MNKLQRRQEGIKRARRVLRVWRGSWGIRPDAREYLKDGGDCEHHLIHTRVPCSCMMCGNPRRNFGERTLQERKADYEYREETIRQQKLGEDNGLNE